MRRQAAIIIGCQALGELVRKPDRLKGNFNPGIGKVVGVGEVALRRTGMRKTGLMIRSELTLIPGERDAFQVFVIARKGNQSRGEAVKCN